MADYDILLRNHVTLTCRSIDRIFLQGYVPQLQSVGQVCRFLVSRGYRILSSAAFGRIGERFAAELQRWATANDIPIVHFAKGDNKEAIARPLIEAAAHAGGDGRVVLLGIAQEKASVWRSWPRPEAGGGMGPVEYATRRTFTAPVTLHTILPSCWGLDDVPSRRRSFAPVEEALNGVEMKPIVGVENVTVLDLDAALAAELAGLIEVGSQPADVAGSRPI